MGSSEEKKILRREVLSLRDGLSVEQRRQRSEASLSRVLALPEYDRARTVLAYVGFGSETETSGFLETALRDGKRLVLPRVDRESNSLALHFVEEPGSELTPGTWGIMEPLKELPQAEILDVDFVLMPGVAFDEAGGRLGYGGGFYDSMIGDLSERPTLVAAAFEVQIVDQVPMEAHDVRVDVISTESRTLERTQ